jgi:methylated-DNA-protein-cysteine methyltransferase related protein
MTNMAQFKFAIYQQLRALPGGRVVAYGQLAALAGYPGYARQVGATLRNLPTDSDLPWHRVVRADGTLPFAWGSEEFNEQQTRLKHEGVNVQNGKVNRQHFLTNAVI